jgi:hypothetical protein
MTDSPPQFIRRVKARGSRIRDTSPPTEPTEKSSSTEVETLAAKLKNKQKQAKSKSRLSFGTDEQVC